MKHSVLGATAVLHSCISWLFHVWPQTSLLGWDFSFLSRDIHKLFSVYHIFESFLLKRRTEFYKIFLMPTKCSKFSHADAKRKQKSLCFLRLRNRFKGQIASKIQFNSYKVMCAIELSMKRRIKTFAKHFCILETERWYLVIKIACVINYEKDCDRVYQIKIDSTVPDTANSGSLHALFSEQA